MEIFAGILGIALLLLLFLFLMQRREMKSMAKQLRAVGGQDTNELVHSLFGGTVSVELMNEINCLLKETRRTRMEYQRKKHALDQMLTNISHDLRTPLTSAMGYVGILKGSGLPQEERARELALVERRLLRLEELLDSFFEFSRIVSGGIQPEREELNLVALLEESIAHYYDDYCGQQREVVLRCDRQKRRTLSSRSLLLRIFDNLIANALKHGTGTLFVSVGGEKSICVRFENELTELDLDVKRVFDEFYTTDISRSRGGTGLGLAIAKQFTELLGGSIAAAYENGVFSVTVDFPEL